MSRTHQVVVLVAIGLATSLLGSVPASANERVCRDYANRAIAAQRTNFEKACGLTGPQWNSDFRYHYDWCMNGRNAETAPGWTRWRDERIARCVGTAQAPQVVQPVRPVVGVIDTVRWNADALTQQVLARLNDGTRALQTGIQRAAQQYQTRGPQRGQIIGTLQPDPAARLGSLQQRAGRAPLGQRIPPRITGQLSLPPEVTNVLIAPRNDMLEPNSSLMINGENFGTTPGRVYLYYVSDNLYGENFQGDGSGGDQLAGLLPLKGDWPSSWYDKLILLKLPPSLPGKYLYADRPAVLIIATANGTRVQRPVTLSGGYPAMRSAHTVGGTITCCTQTVDERWLQIKGTTSYMLWPMDTDGYLTQRHWIQPGERFTLHGRHFGGEPGELSVPGAETVSLRAESWSDDRIEAVAVPRQASDYFELEGASIQVRNTDGREALVGHFAFGPDLDVKRVSGRQWLDAAARPLATTSNDGSAMTVTHAPNCEASSPQEEGYDAFFNEMPWPTDVKIVRFDFQHINPGDPFSDVDFFLETMGDLAGELASKGPAGLLSWAAGMALEAIFGMEGGYHVYVLARPGGMHWSAENKVVGVDWETSCEYADGKPIIYATSFVVVGPKEALSKLQ